MARTDPAVRRAAEELSRPGPYAVASGDLTAAGLPGVVNLAVTALPIAHIMGLSVGIGLMFE